MKRALLALLIILLIAGFVRGWFTLSNLHREQDSNKVGVKLTIDPDQIKQDAERVKEEAERTEEKAREEFRDITRPSNNHDQSDSP
jgi:hypothetical protein